MTITLTGTNYLGQSVTMAAVTDQNGFYSFTGLPAGTYMLTESSVFGFQHNQANVGSVNGNSDVSVLGVGRLAMWCSIQETMASITTSAKSIRLANEPCGVSATMAKRA